MLIKLLKYEFRAAFRELITLYIALLGIASLLRPFYLYNLSGSLTGITVFVYAALIVAVMVMSCITIIQRFSKTMLGPEGYLMHTLPVSATVHIFSKLITAMVIVVAGFLVGTISMLIIAADSSFFLLLRSFWEEFILFLYDLTEWSDRGTGADSAVPVQIRMRNPDGLHRGLHRTPVLPGKSCDRCVLLCCDDSCAR